MLNNTVLITGAAHRIGAEIAKTLHQQGYSIIIHFRNSEEGAKALEDELNNQRANSALSFQADLDDNNEVMALAEFCKTKASLSALINNASSYFPSSIGSTTEQQWNKLMGSNLKAPFFLSQALLEHLKDNGGSIINIIDVNGERPLKDYSAYSIAKAGLGMLTKSFALELGPEIRVNGIAPGPILWPENIDLNEQEKEAVTEKTALKKTGCAQDVASAVLFLLKDAPYVTGQILAVDGGISL